MTFNASEMSKAVDLYLYQHADFIPAAQNKRHNIDEKIFRMLGCPNFYNGTSIQPRDVERNVAPEAAVEEIRTNLARLISELRLEHILNRDMASLLAGAGRYQCWNACSQSYEGAVRLADLILHYIDQYQHYQRSFDEETDSDICDLINGWLKPTVPWEKLPRLYSVCEHMFGDAWCSFSLSAYESLEGSSDLGINWLVQKTRPPFLPGLCRETNSQFSISLPPFDESP
jgi:hypothetical protein